MSAPPTISRHYTMHNGRLVPKQSVSPESYEPKTIKYTHSVRVLHPYRCDHEQYIAELKKKHSLEIEMKDCEIAGLTHRLQMRDRQMNKKQEQVQAYKFLSTLNDVNFNQEKPESLSKFEASLMAQSRKIAKLNKKKQQFVQQIKPKQNKDDLQGVKREMKNTSMALKNITSVLNQSANKKKYVFHNKHLSQKEEIQQQQHLLITPRKQLDSTYNLNDSNNLVTEISDFDLSIDNSSTHQSKDTSQFFYETINEHHILKSALLELQSKTNEQMYEMKQYYQNQIKKYVDLLEISKLDKGQMSLTRVDRCLEENDIESIEKIDVCSSHYFFEDEESLLDD